MESWVSQQDAINTKACTPPVRSPEKAPFRGRAGPNGPFWWRTARNRPASWAFRWRSRIRPGDNEKQRPTGTTEACSYQGKRAQRKARARAHTHTHKQTSNTRRASAQTPVEHARARTPAKETRERTHERARAHTHTNEQTHDSALAQTPSHTNPPSPAHPPTR